MIINNFNLSIYFKFFYLKNIVYLAGHKDLNWACLRNFRINSQKNPYFCGLLVYFRTDFCNEAIKNHKIHHQQGKSIP